LIEKSHKFILGGLAVLVLVFGSVSMLVKPINLNSGQTTSWWGVIKNVETGRGYKACQENYVPNCKLTDQYTATREPVPVLLFALVGLLTQNSVIAFQLVQIVAVMLILLGTFLLGREMGGLSTGLLAAIMWAGYLPALRLESMVTGDLLEGLFVVFGCLKFSHILKRGRTGDWLAFGILFGLAALSRSAALILVCTLGLGYLVYVYIQKLNSASIPAGWFKKAVVSAFAFALVLSPWVIRNWLTFGEPVMGTTLTGYVLYRHNAMIATDASPHFVGSGEANQLVQEFIARHPEIMTSMNEVQVNHLFLDETWALIKSHPGKYLMLSAYRFLPLWFNYSVDEGNGNNMSKWDYVIIFQQVVLLAAFIFGLLKHKNEIDLIGLTGFSIIMYFIAYLAVQGQLRYTIPVAAEVIAIGAVGLLSILPRHVRELLP
jgi:hypothetical protein